MNHVIAFRVHLFGWGIVNSKENVYLRSMCSRECRRVFDSARIWDLLKTKKQEKIQENV